MSYDYRDHDNHHTNINKTYRFLCPFGKMDLHLHLSIELQLKNWYVRISVFFDFFQLVLFFLSFLVPFFLWCDHSKCATDEFYLNVSHFYTQGSLSEVCTGTCTAVLSSWSFVTPPWMDCPHYMHSKKKITLFTTIVNPRCHDIKWMWACTCLVGESLCQTFLKMDSQILLRTAVFGRSQQAPIDTMINHSL